MIATLEQATIARLICPCCSKVMKSTAGLHHHARAKHASYYAEHFVDCSPLIAATRARYTKAQKCAVVDKYTAFQLDPTCKHPYMAATKWAFGKGWRNRTGHLDKWLRACGSVRLRVLKGRIAAKGRRQGETRPADHPDCEDELYIRFLFRRTALGYPANHYWLISEFDNILNEEKPPGYKGKKYTTGPSVVSNLDPTQYTVTRSTLAAGWSVGFCVRFGITSQARNNIKVRKHPTLQALGTKHTHCCTCICRPMTRWTE
jgi:hypothetical protein